jgi:lipoprotein signal peptidase
MHLQSELATNPTQRQRPRSLVASRTEFGQRPIVLALLATIFVVDQTSKWWAFRHLSTFINHGGDILVGSTVSAWFSDPRQGMLLDLLNCVLLSIAISVLWRRRRSLVVLISACMMIGGWGSNLLDRLFMHYFTAPGAGRGAVDFIPFGVHYYNVADAFIVIGTPLFVLAGNIRYLLKRAAKRPSTGTPLPRTGRARRLAPTPVSRFGGGVSLVAVATDDRQ